MISNNKTAHFSLTKTLNINLIFILDRNPIQNSALPYPTSPTASSPSLKLGNYHTAYFDNFLSGLCDRLKVVILKKSFYDFEGGGVSGIFLVANQLKDKKENMASLQTNYHLFHLDKSHLGVHTYLNKFKGAFFFRADFEISTCGAISPLEVIPEVITIPKLLGLSKNLAEIILIDYRERGLYFGELNAAQSAKTNFGLMVKEKISKNILAEYSSKEKEFRLEKIYYLELRKKNIDLKKKKLLEEVFLKKMEGS